ncbi:SAV_2336 N-terminal domain-related protein [Streptomyces sp. NPDC048825]|uniref:SAV_2336 N-terminal domain-related protein n=1 Tax=Streptomyces sp. NPDC048825 TaxID=3365592 RepID=UPI00371E5D4A
MSDPVAADGSAGTGAARLADLLAEVSGGALPTSVELAELLWLARHMKEPEPAASFADPPPVRPERAESEREIPPPESGGPSPPHGPDAAAPPEPERRPDGRVPLRLPGPNAPNEPREPNGSYTSLLAPAPPMLTHPLTLQRALRPLKRRVPAPVGKELDEEATAHRIARLGAEPRWWLPVLRPATERWLTLHLVYDAGPTMPVWRPLVRELHTALAQSGIFRTVELHRLEADGTVRRPGSQESYADGRTITLLVSDCMGPQWRDGPAGTRWYGTLRRWARRMPVAVIQPLPERLWRTTALPASAAQIVAPSPAVPNSAYDVDSYAADHPLPGMLPLPVLEPSAPWLANWSALLANAGKLPGSVALLGHTPPPAPLDEYGRSEVEQLSPEELILRFRSIASPEAYRLAGHLAVGRPELPVMRLVQAAIEQNPQPQHLAEVILSGVLTAIPGPPGSYAFRPGVRELLLRTLPRTAHGRTSELLARIGALIDARAGVAAGDFRVLAPGGGGEAAGGEPFAAVREESVRRLGGSEGGGSSLFAGRYRLIGQRGPSQRMWQAVDVRLNRPVVVHRYPPQAAPRQRFWEEARRLAGLRHSHVVPVLDFGVEDDSPYLVAEFVDGVTVAELEPGNGPVVSFRVFARLVRDVTAGLDALHARGLVRGQDGWDGLLLRPDGTVVLSRFALGEQSEGLDASTDFRAFGQLLRDLASLASDEARFEQFLRQFPRHRFSPAHGGRHTVRELASSPDFEPTATEADFLNFTVLGPPRVHRGERLLNIPSPGAQALLCMLLLKHGRRVTFAELAQGLWEQPPSEGDAARIRPLAIALRECLGPGTLAALKDGYALHAAGDHIDVLHCEDLLNRRTQDQDPRTERGLIQSALDLWYGDPLDGVPGPAAKAARTRLRALRLTLCATRAELDLELGNFEGAANDLAELLRDHPEREDFRRLHILALREQGRIAEAMESYETYEEHRNQQHSEPDPTLQVLYRELRTAPERGRATIVAEFTDPGEHRLAHSVLGRSLTWLLSLTEMAPNQYEVLSRDNGYLVITEPEASVLPVLGAVLRELPGALLELDDPPKVRVTFWHTAQFARADRPTTQPDIQAALGHSAADIMVVLSPVLHQELMRGSTSLDPARFVPLHRESRGEAADGTAIAWYCPLELPERAPAPAPEERDLVRGPLTTRDLGAIRPPQPGRTAIVLSQPDGPLTLLGPDGPYGVRTPWPLTTYYEVDLTTHQAGHEVSLPSSRGDTFAASVELSWHVDDPVAFVRGETADVSGRLLDHLLKEAGRITRRHPLRRAGAAQHAVHDGLRRWPVPGLSVACSVRLTPEGEMPAAGQAPRSPRTPKPVAPGATEPSRSLAALLADAECVLLGFDGPVARLYTGEGASRAARDLATLLVELRPPDEALSGEQLLENGAPVTPLEGYSNPLDLLRALARHRRGTDLRRELDRLEQDNALTARPTPHADALVRTLAATGRGPAIVSDNSHRAVTTYLEARGLIGSATGGVHGRALDLTLLMPHPDCLLRALDQLNASASDAVLIGSSVAELTAANAIGLPFIGYAHNSDREGRLTRAGCQQTVGSLAPVLEAIRDAD